VRLTAADRKDLRVDLKTDSDQSLYEVEVAVALRATANFRVAYKIARMVFEVCSAKDLALSTLLQNMPCINQCRSTRQKHGAQHKNLKRPYQTHSLKILRANIKL